MRFEDIQTDFAVFPGNVWMEDFGLELDGGRFGGVIRRDGDGELKDARSVVAGGRATDDGGPFGEVFAFDIPWA